MNDYPEDMSKEIDEAIRAGRKALDSLRSADDQLDKALKYGLWDMFGGRFTATLLKHSRMDDAQYYIDKAREDLQVFNRELSDVSEYLDIQVQMDDFMTFADYFFDGFFADYLVQKKISEAKDRTEQAIEEVQTVLTKLRMMR